MLQGGFRPIDFWAANFTSDTNIVFDVHNYYFDGRTSTSGICPRWSAAVAKTWATYTQIGACWTYKFLGNVPVDGGGTQGDYWNYSAFIKSGILHIASGVISTNLNSK
ncbi:glucan 1 3-beta-glucosidase A [Fusarium beomiforme]|uniref:Glucan 1 3-beta-glucosidase A n=1 Tax=Fusarium beomiforme TaxID=44412 RepID=A0A9P5A8P3_9HYPO|nr:glucan 1 3-beta-glucosidase A [Fusarium beomiforme]